MMRFLGGETDPTATLERLRAILRRRNWVVTPVHEKRVRAVLPIFWISSNGGPDSWLSALERKGLARLAQGALFEADFALRGSPAGILLDARLRPRWTLYLAIFASIAPILMLSGFTEQLEAVFATVGTLVFLLLAPYVMARADLPRVLDELAPP